MPSPFGEGQTDAPIAQDDQGEVCYVASVGKGKCWHDSMSALTSLIRLDFCHLLI